jgi:mono/diheme cytochrome c family protein
MTRSLLVAALAGGLCLTAGAQNPASPAPTDAAPAPARATPANLPAAVTFAEHVAPIVFDRCASCHRPGEAGPFPLLTYKDVRKRGKLIQQVTARRFMPPWHPAPGHGEFQNERRLSDEQIALLKRWVETGMAEGEPARLPELPKFPEGWQLGKPDLVVSMDRAFEVPATGRDIYRNFVLPLNLKEDKWVTAVELRPSARSVVHHVLFFLDRTGRMIKRDGQGGKPGFSGQGFGLGGSLGGWAAGGQPAHLPQGLGMPLPRGSDLILQTHFHPSGKVEREKTTVGLYFAKKKPERTLVSFQAPPLFGMLSGISIPAGNKEYKVRGTFKAPVDMDLISVGGHAHYVCTNMKATAKLPDGSTKSLLYLPKWDFNWQSTYMYKAPVRLPKGAVIDVELTYDNSAANPANPFDPPRRINWGPASTDEMGSVIFGAVAARESEAAALRQGVTRQLFEAGGAALGKFLKKRNRGGNK